MTNPLEQIRAWRNVVTDQIVSMSGTRAISKEQMEELGRILAASQGYVCVPVEPTEAMINAGSQAGEWGSERDVWSAMLAASKETNRE